MDFQALKGKVYERRKEIAIVFLIFLMGFAVRGYLIQYDLFFEFDSYWHARVISYIIQTGTYPALDPLAYYQNGGAALYAGSDFFWYLNAVIYWIFTFGGAYNKDTWIFFVKILPAIYGGLIAAATYFFGKALYNKRLGYALGFFAAVMPAFVYRQMAGWIEDDSFGFLPFMIGMVFLVKALKKMELNKDTLINALLAGISFGVMAWSWGGYLIVPVILVMFLVLSAIAGTVFVFLKKIEARKLLNFFALTVLAFAVFGVFSYAVGSTAWVERTIQTYTIYLPFSQENVNNLTGGQGGFLGQSVGEENLGHPFWANKYNFLFWLMPIGIIVFFAFLWKDKNLAALLLLSIFIVTLLMGYSKLKFTYYLGLGMALMAGLGSIGLLQLLERMPLSVKRTVGIFVGFMLLVGVGAGSYFVSTNVPNIEYGQGWKETLSWVKDNTPEDSNFFNWWDEGHWITFLGERKAIADNRNIDLNADSDAALFILATDENSPDEIIAKYHAHYIIFGDDLLSKHQSLATYAYQSIDFTDPNLAQYVNSLGVAFPCSKSQEALTGAVSFNCGGNTFTDQQFFAIPTQWSEQPLAVQGRDVFFLYRTPEGDRLYILNPTTNNTFIAKLWFQKPEVALKYEEVFRNQGVKVFKVN